MTFDDYAKYSLTEFLEDDSFVSWVTDEDPRSHSFWTSFLKMYPDKLAVVNEAASVIRAYRKQQVFHNEERLDEVWKKIDASISRQSPVVAPRIFPWYLKVAATVTLLALFSLTYWLLSDKHTVTITTVFGEVKAVTLPDQSIVMLNGNSILTYDDTWTAHSPREVWIKGEAYFDVKHLNRDTTSILPEERFIVHGNGIDIQVLGTSFNVKSRRNKTNIALLSGKIEVSSSDKAAVVSGGIVMLPGDYVEYSGQKLLTKKKLLRPHKAATWTVREITFTDPSLNDIMENLQDNYGYAVNVEDQHLMNMKIEGEISVTSVQELLAVVSSSLGISIEESGKEIIITRK